MKSLFEELGGTYRPEGDYLIPNLSLPPETEELQIGKYGSMREKYLKDHRKGLYAALILSGKLTRHLYELNEEAIRVIEQASTAMLEPGS